MSNDDVINLNTKKSFAELVKERERLEDAYEKVKVQSISDNKTALLKILNHIKKMVEDDKLDGLVVAGRNPENGLFFSEILMNEEITRANIHYAYAGVLDMMKMEMLDDATSGPHMDHNGEYFGFCTPRAAEDILGLNDD